MDSMINEIKGKTILVTGGTGSVGVELVKALLPYEPRSIRIFDIDESKQFEFQQEMAQLKRQGSSFEGIYTDNISYLLGNIREKDRLLSALEDVDMVFHMAGLKHVYACEYNPFEAIKTNIIGTQNIIDASIEKGVKKVLFTSSDKAANPSSTMGTSKLMAEKIMTAANYYKGNHDIRFSIVRFGNIIGSRGSVIPLFKNQIQSGGPLTLTHPDMTRFMITMPDTIQFLIDSIHQMKGGEIFVLKMPVIRIQDLAEAMRDYYAPKFGYKPEDINIHEIDIKPGEKLYEEVLTEEEGYRLIETDDKYIILPQIQEILKIDMDSYENARKPETIIYASQDKDANVLSKPEIIDLLNKMEMS